MRAEHRFLGPCRAFVPAVAAFFWVTGVAGCGGEGVGSPPPEGGPEATGRELAEGAGTSAEESVGADSGAPMDASPGWDLETPIYSLEQAERGAGIVLEVCSRCHAPEAYTNFDFRFRWSGSSVGELYRFVSATMPQDAPGQLEPEEYAAALAYIFRENRLPAGDRELGTDFSELHRHRLVIPTGP